MKTTNDATYVVRIYLSGPIEVAKQIIRAEAEALSVSEQEVEP